jgi:hypothetical protein
MYSATAQLRREDPEAYPVTEIDGNFNTWELAASFEQADPKDFPILVTAFRESCPYLVTFNTHQYQPGHWKVTPKDRSFDNQIQNPSTRNPKSCIIKQMFCF